MPRMTPMPKPDPCAFWKALSLSALLACAGAGISFLYAWLWAVKPEIGGDFILDRLAWWTAAVWFYPYVWSVDLVTLQHPPNAVTVAFTVAWFVTFSCHYAALLFLPIYGMFLRRPWIIIAGVALIVLNLLAWPLIVAPMLTTP